MHKTTKNIMSIGMASALAFALSVQSARAAASLELFDGFTTITIMDGSGLDASAAPGVIIFNGVIGVWDINVSTGLTKPIIGSPSNPQMDLNSIDHSTGPGFLRIRFTDTGFIASPGSATAAIGGTQGNGDVRFRTYQNLTLLTDSGVLASTPFMNSASAPVTVAAPYALTEEVIINHTAAGVTSWDASLEVTFVPEGDTLFAMLGLAAVGGAFALRRRKLAVA